MGVRLLKTSLLLRKHKLYPIGDGTINLPIDSLIQGIGRRLLVNAGRVVTVDYLKGYPMIRRHDLPSKGID